MILLAVIAPITGIVMRDRKPNRFDRFKFEFIDQLQPEA